MKPFPLQREGVKDTMAPSATDREYRRSMALDALEQDPARPTRTFSAATNEHQAKPWSQQVD